MKPWNRMNPSCNLWTPFLNTGKFWIYMTCFEGFFRKRWAKELPLIWFVYKIFIFTIGKSGNKILCLYLLVLQFLLERLHFGPTRLLEIIDFTGLNPRKPTGISPPRFKSPGRHWGFITGERLRLPQGTMKHRLGTVVCRNCRSISPPESRIWRLSSRFVFF